MGTLKENVEVLMINLSLTLMEFEDTIDNLVLNAGGRRSKDIVGDYNHFLG